MPTEAVETPAPEARPRRKSKPKAKPDEARRLADACLLLKAGSEPTRAQALLLLAEESRHVGALCAASGQSQPATSHHLAILRHARLIEPRREGKRNFYSVTATGQALADTLRDLMDA